MFESFIGWYFRANFLKLQEKSVSGKGVGHLLDVDLFFTCILLDLEDLVEVFVCHFRI